MKLSLFTTVSTPAVLALAWQPSTSYAGFSHLYTLYIFIYIIKKKIKITRYKFDFEVRRLRGGGCCFAVPPPLLSFLFLSRKKKKRPLQQSGDGLGHVKALAS